MIPAPERIDLYDAAQDKWLCYTPDTAAYQGLLARARARIDPGRWIDPERYGKAGERSPRVYTYTAEEDAQMLRDSGQRFVQLVYYQPRLWYNETRSDPGYEQRMDRLLMPLGDVPESLHADLAGQMIYLKEDLVVSHERACQFTAALRPPDELAAYVEALFASDAPQGAAQSPALEARPSEAFPVPDAVTLSRPGLADKTVDSGERDFMWLMLLIRQRLPASGCLTGRAVEAGGGLLTRAGAQGAAAAWALGEESAGNAAGAPQGATAPPALGARQSVILSYEQPVYLAGACLGGAEAGWVDRIVMPLDGGGRVLYLYRGWAVYASDGLGPADGLTAYLRNRA